MLPRELDPHTICPSWLTAVLRSGQLLDDCSGTIQAIHPSHIQRHATSTVGVLRLTWSSDASCDAPKSLFLKIAQADLATEVPREVLVYRRNLCDDTATFLPRAYVVEYWPNTGQYLLILPDLTSTHHLPKLPLPPREDDLMSMVKTLAEFHAHGWDGDAILAMIPTYTTEFQRRRLLACVAGQVENVRSVLEQRLVSAYISEFLSSIIVGCDQWIDRLQSQRHVTLIHGDAHAHNILVSRSSSHPNLLVDWNSPHWIAPVNLGATDLANLLMRCISRDRCASLATSILPHYHRWLKESGVHDYRWEEFECDFGLALRYCALGCLHQSVFAHDFAWLMALENVAAIAALWKPLPNAELPARTH